MKLLTSKQIRDWDKYTIEHEPVTSIDLMERASFSFVNWFVLQYHNINIPICIFCGNGNNGGDGLAVARLLRDRFYTVKVFILRFGKEDSVDFDINLSRLMSRGDVDVEFIHDDLPIIDERAIIIDALLGTGTNKPVDGLLSILISHINKCKNTVVSIDMPSGLPAESTCDGDAILSDKVFSFQIPKLSFFLKENEKYCTEWTIGDIGLSPDYLNDIEPNTFLVDGNFASTLYKKRGKFQHKGDFGHALIIAGSEGKIGASVLCAKACLKAGAGLVTALVPETGIEIIHETIPEAMVLCGGHQCFNKLNCDPNIFSVGIGPGLGKDRKTVFALNDMMQMCKKPLVLDADALNIMADNRNIIDHIPKRSIITPHPKEFDRLFGYHDCELSRLSTAKRMAGELTVYIVLKGAYTRILTPDGIEYINSTGNPGMATAGSGDVLTGIITSFLAQGYLPGDAAILGVYLHGLGGDLALGTESQESIIASDIILNLGKAFKLISH